MPGTTPCLTKSAGRSLQLDQNQSCFSSMHQDAFRWPMPTLNCLLVLFHQGRFAHNSPLIRALESLMKWWIRHEGEQGTYEGWFMLLRAVIFTLLLNWLDLEVLYCSSLKNVEREKRQFYSFWSKTIKSALVGRFSNPSENRWRKIRSWKSYSICEGFHRVLIL